MVKSMLLSIYRPIYIMLLVINTILTGFMVILCSFFDPSGNFVGLLGKTWSRLNLFLVGVCVRLTGLENISKGQPYIIMINHQSLFDVWALAGFLPIQMRWIVKKELRKVPLFGIACERMGQIFIDRKNPEQSHVELQVLKSKFKNGASAVFAPEGTRSPDGKLLPFKKGGFVMALRTGIPILPVTINGSRFCLPRSSIKFYPGVIRINVHKPVSVDGYTYDTKEKLMDLVRGTIEAKLDAADTANPK